MALSKRQEMFVAEFLRTFNATQAAIAAGYSEATAGSQGARLLKNVNVAARVEQYLNDHAMGAAEVLYHLTEIARGDIGDVIDSDGAFDYERARAAGKTRLIKGITRRTVTTEASDVVEDALEMYDRLSALDKLARYHNLTNRVRVDDWRSQAIEDIRAGRIAYEALAEAFDDTLATQLFAAAGVAVQVGAGATEE